MPSPPRILAAEFETSAASQDGWPAEGPDEIAFVGRSNVGKSSLLNTLAERRGLARTSADPGRTRLVNFFVLELGLEDGTRRAVRFVDLPGYGYAKVSKAERSTWRKTIQRYLEARKTLRAVMLLVDARRVPERPPGKDADDEDALVDERELLRWIAARGVRVITVMTKADKLSKAERAPTAQRLRQYLGGGAPVLFSALSGEGKDPLALKVAGVLGAAAPAPEEPGA